MLAGKAGTVTIKIETHPVSPVEWTWACLPVYQSVYLEGWVRSSHHSGHASTVAPSFSTRGPRVAGQPDNPPACGSAEL